MLKKLAIALCLYSALRTPHSALGQFTTPIDTTTLTTNTYTLNYLMTISGVCTNALATTVNTNFQVTGDAGLTEAMKINSGFANAWLWALAQSNFVLRVSGNSLVVSNHFIVASNRLAAFWATNIPGEPQFLHFLTTNSLVADFYHFLSTNISGGGGGGNVTFGGPMRFDFDGITTNITSDGAGHLGLNSITSTNMTTAILPFDSSDPPGSWGFQMLTQDNPPRAVYQAHVYSAGNEFPIEDYTTYGGNFFSWSMIDGPTSARWGFLNVTEEAGPTIVWHYEPDSGASVIMDVDGSFGVNAPTPAFTLDDQGTFGCDYGQIYTDGSGNLTAQTFNPVSDRTLKEQIKPLAPAKALAMVLSLTNYSWRFKAHTNFAITKIPTSLGTNWVAFSRTNPAGRVAWHTNAVVVTNHFALATNVGKVFPASGTEFGPMAQEWHAATGLQDGHKISATSEAGLLIGAVQSLAALQGVFTNAAGAGFRLIVNAQTNGFIFVPQ